MERFFMGKKNLGKMICMLLLALWTGYCSLIGKELMGYAFKGAYWCFGLAAIMYAAAVIGWKKADEVKLFDSTLAFLMAVGGGMASLLIDYKNATSWNVIVGELGVLFTVIYVPFAVNCAKKKSAKEIFTAVGTALVVHTVGAFSYGVLSTKTRLGLKPFNVLVKTMFKWVLSQIENIKKNLKKTWRNRPSRNLVEVIWVEVANLTKEIYNNYNLQIARKQLYLRYGCFCF